MRLMNTANAGKKSAEAWTLALLFGLYLALTIYAERTAQQTTTKVTPSSFNTKTSGLKAYYLLLEQQGFRVDRLRAPWQSVGAGDRLLIVAEPTDKDRPVLPAEASALKKWVESGGSLLYFTAAPPRELDPNDPLLGDLAVTTGGGDAQTAAPEKPDSPYFAGVKAVEYESPVRIKPAKKAKYTTLLKDDDGALLIEKTLGKGRIVVAALGEIAGNGAIRKADNAVLLVNFASALGGDGAIQFDEYHHGVGFAAAADATGGVWSVVPVPLRLALYAGFLLFAALLYNNNRMFGRLRPAPPIVPRSSADYVGSAGTLLHRAGAADLAIAMIYERFVRDLNRALDLPPDSELSKTVSEAQRKFSINAPQFQQTLTRCEAARQGERMRESEMLALARQIESYRRVCQLV